MSQKIFTVSEVVPHLHEDYELNSINFTISETNILVERAFNGLINAGVINSLDYTEETIKYESDSGDDLAISRYAVFDDIAYLSWIWVSEPLRGNGYGKLLTKQTIDRISKHNISRIFTIPKSDEASYIFGNNFGFTTTNTDLSSGWRVLKS